MPHVVIEYSKNIASDIHESDIGEKLHYALGHCGLFKLDDIKTRLYEAEHYHVADRGQNGSFLHVTLSIKSGRSDEQKEALSKTVLDLLVAHVAKAEQLSVDIRELHVPIYQKFVR